MAFPTSSLFVAGATLTAAQLNAVRADLNSINGYVAKTADQSVTSSTVLANDTHLAFTVAAVGTYVIDWTLIGTSAVNAAGDLNVAWTFPAASLAWASGFGPDISLASLSVSTGQWGANTLTTGTLFNSYGLSTFFNTIQLRTLFTFTATGTVRLQWCQNSSNVNASTLKIGSHLLARQVA